MTEETKCHVRLPGPDETPPPPTVPVRNRDQVLYRALVSGYDAAQAKDPKATLNFEAWSAGVTVTLEYLRAWDRRRTKAIDEVL